MSCPCQVHIEFSDEKDSISLERPPQEVERAKDALETFTKDLVSTAQMEIEKRLLVLLWACPGPSCLKLDLPFPKSGWR